MGGLIALGIGWLLAVLALHQPALGLRAEIRASVILPRLLSAVPAGPRPPGTQPLRPAPAPARAPGDLASAGPERAAEPGCEGRRGQRLKLEGTACGVGTQGSGWVVRPGLVATNAHVIAGHEGTRALAPNGQVLSAQPVYVDSTNDIALVRVRGLDAPSPRR